MAVNEKKEAQSILSNLPDECSFEHQYHLYVAEKLRNARHQVEEGKVVSQKQVEEKLDQWIIR